MTRHNEDRPHYRSREDLEQFEPLNTPLWVFDVDRHAMWWGNASALAFWRVKTLDALLARDYSSDSETVRTRLRQMVDNTAGAVPIQEIWTLYPDESPTTIIAVFQPVLIEDGRNAVMLEATRALDLKDDPEALRILEAARSSALMVSSFTMSGLLLSQNPASHACYTPAPGAPGHNTLADRFVDTTVSASILAAVDREGHFEAELAVRTAGGERIHRVLARRGRDPVTGEFVVVLNEEDMTEQAALRRDLQKLNNELEERVAERTKRLEALNDDLVREIEERQAAEEKLRRAQRMEAIGQLTGGVAHDFNNLLTAIIINMGLAKGRTERDDRLVEATLQTARRAAELTQRLVAFSRQQPLAPRPVDLGSLASNMSEFLARSLDDTIEIRTGSPPGLWQAEADPGQVENALLNLALNARDAMPDGGHLAIEASNVTVTDGSIDGQDGTEQDRPAPGDYVVLAVSDDGTGMPAEVQARAFEPFFTTKEVGGGSGLGLSMVYGFAEQSGGLATIDSEPGHGTTIRLYLPRSTG